MPLLKHGQGTGTVFLIPGHFASEGLLHSSSSPEPQQVSSRIHFGSQLVRLKTNDTSMAFDGFYMGDSAISGYYGNGDLWQVKVQGKVYRDPAAVPARKGWAGLRIGALRNHLCSLAKQL